MTISIKCAVFDFDGTLVQSNDIKRLALFEAVSPITGAAPYLETIWRADIGDRMAIYGRLESDLREAGFALAPGEHAKAWALRYTELCERQIASAPEVEGAEAALQFLKARGTPAYVASLTPLYALEPILRARRLMSYLKGAYGRPTTKSEALAAIAANEKLQPAEMLLIGDGAADLEAARSYGTRFIAIGAELRPHLRGGERWAADLTVLPELLGAVV